MVTKRSVAETPQAVVERLLSVASDDEVLVGGQALGVWVDKYDLPLPDGMPVITLDIDFLTQSPTARASVEKFAAAIHGKTIFPGRLDLTALVGQAQVDLPGEKYLNVDTIFQVVGLDPKRVQARAVRMLREGSSALVMHPLDVLRSRLYNLHELIEKQNPIGALQLRLAVDVARAYLGEEAAQAPAVENASGRSALQPLISEIEKLAIDDAGRKVAIRWGVHVADAIDPSLIPAGPFWDRKWPTLKMLMSPDYSGQFSPPCEN